MVFILNLNFAFFLGGGGRAHFFGFDFVYFEFFQDLP